MIYTTLTADQISTARETLYESIPITGTLVSGTYGTYPNDTNVLKFTASHGLFESVYDYQYASSSANHIFDLTYGVRSGSALTPVTQSAEKYRIYKEMAQTLLGFDVTDNVKNFVINGSNVDRMLFVNFSRLLTKDGIKIGSFTASIGTGSWATPFDGGLKQLSDNPSSTYLTVNSDSPVGQYWKIYSGTTYTDANQIGFLFYQQGVLALNQGNSIFDYIAYSSSSGYLSGSSLASTGTITEVSDGFRRYVNNLQFQNTVQINSTIYNCQVGLNQYNYSSNITYTSASQIVVKNSVIDTPVPYVTTVGLYDEAQNLLAVGKLSQPLPTSATTDTTILVNIDM